MIRPRTTLTALALLAALAVPTGAAHAAPAQDTEQSTPTGATLGKREKRNIVLEEMRAAEVLHRERLATIHRLGVLAEARGDARRLAELDKLEVKENARYHRQFERRRARVDDGSFREAQLVLGKGRERAATAEALAERAARVVPLERRQKRIEMNKARADDAGGASDRAPGSAPDASTPDETQDDGAADDAGGPRSR
jgi:hypothetical protein